MTRVEPVTGTGRGRGTDERTGGGHVHADGQRWTQAETRGRIRVRIEARTRARANAWSRALRRWGGPLLLCSLLLPGCRVRRNPPRERPPSGRYSPRTRNVTITTIPLLTKEMQQVYPFLKQDFAAGAVLAGKEVYTFSPSTITAVSGDTLRLTLVNPEDDLHSFVLPDFYVSLPPQSRVDTTYVARAPGIYPFTCSIPAHLPFMWGQLVVLSADAMSTGSATPLLGR